MKPINETIAIYWGAFNPPTVWHSEVISGVLESWIVDKIIFSPDGMRKDKNYGISPEKRTEIIEIFFSELKARHGDKIDISRYFMWREQDKATTTHQVDTYFRETLGFCSTSYLWKWHSSRYARLARKWKQVHRTWTQKNLYSASRLWF